jgi:hypothetical protein
MKSLVLALGGVLTTFVILLWLCGRFADTTPISESFATPAPDAGQFTPYAKRPPVHAPHPAYRVTPLGRYSKPDALFPCADSRLPKFAPLPGYMFAVSSAGNKHGQIVGTLRLYGAGAWLVIQDHGFLWQRGRMHNLGSLPGYQISDAVAINNQGVIVGSAAADSFPANENIPGHAVCWIGDKIRDLGIGEASAINDSNTIVGVSAMDTGDIPREPHALLWTHGCRYDLNDCIPPHSGWLLSQAAHIDDHSRVTGYGTFHGQPRMFRLTPQKIKL